MMERVALSAGRCGSECVEYSDIYEKTLNVFRDYYQYEVIQGADRKMVEKIPEAAFREAIANALIHRLSEDSDKRCYEKKNIMRS